MGKFGKKKEINLNPLHYNIGLLGESGIGKTTIIKEICEKIAGEDGYIAFDIGKEDGHEAISGIVSEPIWDWKKFKEVTDDIVENKDSEYPNLQVVVIDTYDEFCRIAEDEAVRLWNKSHSDKKAETINGAWGGFGKGLDKTIELMLESLWELKKVGVSFIIVGHTKKKDVDDVVSEEQYSTLTSNATQKYFNAIKTKLHFLGLAYIDREIVKEKTRKKDKDGNIIMKGRVTGESRVISFRDDTYSVDSKSRFADIVDRINFDSDAFIKAMEDAILTEHSKGSLTVEESLKKQKKEDKERKQEATKYSNERKKNHFDIEENEGYIEIIKDKLMGAKDDVKNEVKSIMAEYNIKNFKSVEVPTEGLKKIAKLLS
ncbi:AAA family ATPase [Anaerovoracaceae bacterium 41-7]